MTITEPARAGRAWEDEDYETLVKLAKVQADLSAIAAAVQRGESATWQRLRLLLPVEHRNCPRDRIVPALHDAVQQPDYDWRAVILQTPRLRRSKRSCGQVWMGSRMTTWSTSPTLLLSAASPGPTNCGLDWRDKSTNGDCGIASWTITSSTSSETE